MSWRFGIRKGERETRPYPPEKETRPEAEPQAPEAPEPEPVEEEKPAPTRRVRVQGDDLRVTLITSDPFEVGSEVQVGGKGYTVTNAWVEQGVLVAEVEPL